MTDEVSPSNRLPRFPRVEVLDITYARQARLPTDYRRGWPLL
jgi:hypothetical protein